MAARFHGESPSLPLDIEGLARREGLHVVSQPLPAAVMGFQIEGQRVIVLNSRCSARLRRFTLAHEFAELICTGTGNDRQGWMNEFAGHLLVPLPDLHAQIVAGERSLERFGMRYDVGESVILYQMNYLPEWMQYRGISLS